MPFQDLQSLLPSQCFCKATNVSTQLPRDSAEPATREGKREARALGQQVKESEEFLRRRGSEAPAVVALSFLSAAAAALAPLVMVRPLPQAHFLATQSSIVQYLYQEAPMLTSEMYTKQLSHGRCSQ